MSVIDKCHKYTIKRASKGTLLEPIENYTRWAYWCSNSIKSGWVSKPCSCKVNSDGTPRQ